LSASYIVIASEPAEDALIEGGCNRPGPCEQPNAPQTPRTNTNLPNKRCDMTEEPFLLGATNAILCTAKNGKFFVFEKCLALVPVQIEKVIFR
jgi:hypothetical protein